MLFVFAHLAVAILVEEHVYAAAVLAARALSPHHNCPGREA